MTPLVVMVVDEDHGMLGVSHAPTLVVHASQLTKLLPRNATSNLAVIRTKLFLYGHVAEVWHVLVSRCASTMYIFGPMYTAYRRVGRLLRVFTF
jgi:hypothetical protein